MMKSVIMMYNINIFNINEILMTGVMKQRNVMTNLMTANNDINNTENNGVSEIMMTTQWPIMKEISESKESNNGVMKYNGVIMCETTSQ